MKPRIQQEVKTMHLLIDNYDSFSYNVYQLIGAISPEVLVKRNDEITVEEIKRLQPETIILSPGPGRPIHAGICLEVIRECGGKIPIIGICLGHQAICEAFGADISYAKELMHGKTSVINIKKGSKIFKGLPNEIHVARYHSLSAKTETMPSCLRVVATSEDGEIMAVEHTAYPIYGVQFHPESILTQYGREMMLNILGQGAYDD